MSRRSWLPWVVMVVVALGALVIGGTRASEARTQEERIEAIAETVKCPVCPGEAVSDSRNPTSLAIRNEIARQVRAGVPDDEIRADLASRFGDDVLLVPAAEGVDALVWILPVVAGVVVLAGLVVTVRRWRRAPDPVPAGASAAPSASSAGGRSGKAKVAAWVAVIGVAAVGAGVLVARSAGQRRPGDTATGGITESVATRLSQARQLQATDTGAAVELYREVLDQDPENLEALTYLGWLTAISGVQSQDQALGAAALQAGEQLIDRAIALDSTYADPSCFKAVIRFRFQDDAEGAKSAVERCVTAEPPAEVRALVEGLADDIDAALAGG